MTPCCDVPGCVAHFGPDEACARCQHPLAKHGAGCTVGWIEPGPECFCPNDYDGELAVGCCHMGCGTIATHADRTGQFYCPQHAVQAYPTTPFDEIAGWAAS